MLCMKLFGMTLHTQCLRGRSDMMSCISQKITFDDKGRGGVHQKMMDDGDWME